MAGNQIKLKITQISEGHGTHFGFEAEGEKNALTDFLGKSGFIPAACCSYSIFSVDSTPVIPTSDEKANPETNPTPAGK